jgi:hypothetical protein
MCTHAFKAIVIIIFKCNDVTQYYSSDQIEKNEMGGTCSSMGERRNVYRVLVGKPEGRDHLKNPGVDGRIILRWIFRKWVVGA